MIYGTIPSSDMPHPACLVEYDGGGVGAAMFHFCGDEDDLAEVAAANGYDLETLELPEDDPLFVDETVLAKWRPAPREGWTFGGVSMSEDGPVAIFLKAFADAQDDEQEAVA